MGKLTIHITSSSSSSSFSLTKLPPVLNRLPFHLFTSSPSSSLSCPPSPPRVHKQMADKRGRASPVPWEVFLYERVQAKRMCAYGVRRLFTSAAERRQLLLPVPPICQPTTMQRCLSPEIQRGNGGVQQLPLTLGWINSVGRRFFSEMKK